MAYELAQAYVQIIPTTKGMKDNLTAELSEKTEKAADKSGKGFGSKFLKVAGGAIAGGAAAIGTASTAVWAAANSIAEQGDEIDKTSQKLGVSAEAYQAMAFAAEHCGFETSKFTEAAKHLTQTDFDGTLDEALNAILELEDPLERTAMAQELFGNEVALSIAPLLNGTDTIEDYKESLRDIGGLMSNEAVASSAAFEDSITDLQKAFGGLQAQALGEFLPMMTDVMNGLVAFINGDESGLSQMKKGVLDFIDNVTAMLPQFIDLGVNLVTEMIVGIVEALPSIVAKAPEIIMALAGAIIKAIPKLVDAGYQMVRGIWQGIGDAKSWLMSQISGWVDSVLAGIRKFFGIHSPSKVMADQVGKFLPAGIAAGINANASVVDEAMHDLMESTTGTATANVVANVKANSMAYTGSYSNNSNVEALVSMCATYLPVIAEKAGVTITTDAQKIFSVVREENNRYIRTTGYNPLAV